MKKKVRKTETKHSILLLNTYWKRNIQNDFTIAEWQMKNKNNLTQKYTHAVYKEIYRNTRYTDYLIFNAYLQRQIVFLV